MHRIANSLFGSLLNQLTALGLLALLFAGMFLHKRGVPMWLLIPVGAVLALALHLIQRQIFLRVRGGRRRR